MKRIAIISLLSLGILVSCQSQPLRSPSQSLSIQNQRTQWQTLPSMPEPRYNLQATQVGSLFYLTGGFNDRAILDQFESFNPQTKKWAILPPLTTPRYIHAATSLNNELYLLGGYKVGVKTETLLKGSLEARGAIDLFEKYSPALGKWQALPSMPVPRFMPAAAAHQGKIYVAGGGNQQGVLNSVDIYDPKTSSWQQGVPLPAPRIWGQLVSDGQFLYYLGGMSPDKHFSASIDRFDASTGRWETQALPPMPSGRGGFSASVTPDGIYIAGGSNPGGFIDQVDFLSFKTQKWSALPKIKPGRAGLDLLATPQGLYLFGTDAWYTNNAQYLALNK